MNCLMAETRTLRVDPSHRDRPLRASPQPPLTQRRPGQLPRILLPLYTIFFFAPLSPLPFPSVQIVLSILLPCIAALTAILWLRILGASLSVSWVIATICLTLASYPVLEGVYAGQPGLVSAALIAGTMAALAKDRFTLAGILLPCASVKPQLILLIALWLMAWAFSDWTRRRNFLITFALTTLMLLACSTWVLPNWFASWMHTLHEYRRISPPPRPVRAGSRGRKSGVVVSTDSRRVSLLAPASAARFL